MGRATWRTIRVLALCVSCLAVSGCSLFERSASCAARKIIAPDVLKVQSETDTPSFCRYHRALAELYAPYAIASLNAYAPLPVRSASDTTPACNLARWQELAEKDPAGIEPVCCSADAPRVRCPSGAGGWVRDAKANKSVGGLFMEAFVHDATRLAIPDTIEYVIAFRGTEPKDLQDWRANFRWVMPYLRRTDQYPAARTTAVEWVARACRTAKVAGKRLRIVTTGHSLGGGLAQGAAYAILRALPPEMTREQLEGDSTPTEEELASQALLKEPCANLDPPIRVVSVAFDPSPVTGYRDGQPVSACENPRSIQCRLPIVVRVYESGEILAPVRRLLSWFYPVSLNICEDRFNFGTGLPISQHQMRRIASGLIRTAAEYDQSSEENRDMAKIFAQYCATGSGDVLACDTSIPPELKCPVPGS